MFTEADMSACSDCKSFLPYHLRWRKWAILVYTNIKSYGIKSNTIFSQTFPHYKYSELQDCLHYQQYPFHMNNVYHMNHKIK